MECKKLPAKKLMATHLACKDLPGAPAGFEGINDCSELPILIPLFLLPSSAMPQHPLLAAFFLNCLLKVLACGLRSSCFWWPQGGPLLRKEGPFAHCQVSLELFLALVTEGAKGF